MAMLLLKPLRSVAEQQVHINDARDRLEALEAKKKLEIDAEFYGPKHPMPTQLKSDIDLNEKLLKAQKLVTVSLENQMQRINQKYDSMRERRHDLLEKGSAPMSCENGPSQ